MRLMTSMIAVALLLVVWTTPTVAGDRGEGFNKALEVYKQRADVKKHQEAANAFADLAKAHPRDKELQIFCARTAYFCAHRLKGKEKEKVATWGVECSKRILKQDKTDYDGRYWWARTSLKQRESEGIQAALKQAKVVRDFVDKMVKDEPGRFEGYMALGSMLRGIPGFLGGDKVRALEILKKGYELAPKDAELLLELAAGYAANGDKEKAAEVYDQCIKNSLRPEHLEWETDDAIAYAKKMKSKL